jgi:hypothetical protein
VKREDIIEGFEYVTIKFRKTGYFIYLTEKSPDMKNHPEKEDMSGESKTSGHPKICNYL